MSTKDNSVEHDTTNEQPADTNEPVGITVSDDVAWTPNPNGEWQEPFGMATCINTIAHDGEPHVLRNVAIYYRQMNAPWASNMADMLERLAGVDAANDNRLDNRQHGAPRNRRAA